MSPFKVQGVNPQAAGGLVYPQHANLGWMYGDFAAAASNTIALPGGGVDAYLKLLIKGDTAATSIGLTITLIFDGGEDTTTGDYHWQQVGGSNAASIVAEGTNFTPCIIAAGNSVSTYYSIVLIAIPFIRKAAVQRSLLITSVAEKAALDQTLAFAVHKRQTAGVGTLVDVPRSLKIACTAGNVLGTYGVRAGA
jgi:hypothetical protein